MPEENAKKQQWVDKLRSTYRLVVINEETFEEVGSYRLSQLNVYLMLSTLVVLVTIGTVLLVVFTPLKHYIPGYGDTDMRGKMERMAMQVTDMQERINSDSIYISNFKKLLAGDYQNTAEAMQADDSGEDLANSAKMPDSLSEIARTYDDEKMRVELESTSIIKSLQEQKETKTRDVSNIIEKKSTPIEQLYFVPPVRGDVSQGYLPNEKHFAVDVVAPKNTAIKSVMDGVVVVSDWTLETGNTIGIQHKNNIVSFYKHNSVLLKKAGSSVKAGEAIAIIGNTGELSSGPHLHFELWLNGKPINPLDYINFN